MVVSTLGAGIEQRCQVSGVRVDSADIGAFVQVAVEAGVRQVREFVRTTVLACNYVFDVECGQVNVIGGQ